MREIFQGDIYVYDLDGSDGFMDIFLSQNSMRWGH